MEQIDRVASAISENMADRENGANRENRKGSQNRDLSGGSRISIIILVCDEVADISVTIKSLEHLKDKLAECIVADAAGVLQPEQLEKQAISVRYCSLAENIYQNMAQLKNDAVKLADNDGVLLVNAGERVCLDKVVKPDVTAWARDKVENFRTMFAKFVLSGRGIIRHVILSRRMLDVVGGWNPNLDCGEDYELALRICDYGCDVGGIVGSIDHYGDDSSRVGGMCSVFVGSSFDSTMADSFGVVLNEEGADVPVFREDYYTYAYVISKYVGKLKAFGLFDEVFLNRYNEAVGYGIEDYFVACQENFMSKGELFNKVDEATRAVLVFMEKSACNGVLYRFAEMFAAAVRELGQNVYTYTIEMRGETLTSAEELTNVITARSYKAAVEFQAGVFTTQLMSGELVGNILKCPKFMYEFDHPLYISWHFMLPIKDYYVLSQDETYAEYLKEYFPNVKGAWHLPLAGEQANRVDKEAEEVTEKQYGLTFVAAYNDYRSCLPAIKNMAKDERRIALKVLQMLKNNPDLTAEAALKSVLEKTELNGSGLWEGCLSPDNKRNFAALLHKMREVVHAVTFYYREKVVKNLVEAGIEIHVFSDTWKKCPFADNDKLVIHHDVPYEEGLKIIAESRATLNVMSWHKGGMTERVANAMLNKAVCITDKTTYIERHFSDGKDIVMFDLKDAELLPARIKKLLSKESMPQCKAIAEAAYKKALTSHTWGDRAKAFMQILSEIS